MRTILLGGLAAVAALLLVSIAAIVLFTHGEEPGDPAQGRAAALPPPEPAPPAALPPAPAVDLARAPLGGVPLPQAVIVTDARPPLPAPGSWEAVPILAARRGAMGLDVEALQPRLTQCFHPDVEARYGPTPFAEVKDSAPLQDDATTVLLLELEVSGDRLRVVDAPVESRGAAGDGTLACAQAVLRGQTAPAAGLAAGRHRARFVLAP
jgi:hypothetical protein